MKYRIIPHCLHYQRCLCTPSASGLKEKNPQETVLPASVDSVASIDSVMGLSDEECMNKEFRILNPIHQEFW